jgi:hypothetical protein
LGAIRINILLSSSSQGPVFQQLSQEQGPPSLPFSQEQEQAQEQEPELVQGPELLLVSELLPSSGSQLQAPVKGP